MHKYVSKFEQILFFAYQSDMFPSCVSFDYSFCNDEH